MKALTTAAAAIAMLFALVGCSTAIPNTTIDDAAVEATTAPPMESTEPAESAKPERPKKKTEAVIEPAPEPPESERGYLIKEIGEEAALTSYDYIDLVVFTIDAIELDPPCTSGYPEASANGHFIAVTITAQTFPELSDAEIDTVSFSEWAWEAYSTDGVRLNDPVGTAYSCLAEGELMPFEIGPGQKVTGKIVLDVSDVHGAIAFVPYAGLGWEWRY